MLPWLDDRCPTSVCDKAYSAVNEVFPAPEVKPKESIVIEYIKGNLLDTDSGVIAHCANCFNTMGAGVAAAIKSRFPEAYIADCKTKQGDRGKLGGFSKSAGKPVVYNLYGQYNYGFSNGKPPIDYFALNNAMVAMRTDLIRSGYAGTISLPRLGAGLAGGDWTKIEKIISDTLSGTWQVKIYSL